MKIGDALTLPRESSRGVTRILHVTYAYGNTHFSFAFSTMLCCHVSHHKHTVISKHISTFVTMLRAGASRTGTRLSLLGSRRLLSTTKANQSTTSRRASPILTALAMTTTAAGAFAVVHEELGGTEGFFRSLSFYSVAIPKYVVYRYHSWRKSPDDVWEQLDKETSQQGLEKILQLQGFYIKCGQMVASNIGNAFPTVWQDTMAVLQDEVPSQPFSVIKDIVARELDFANTFQSFDPVPIGSASIGQVHRAVLKDGRKVVVKVCYPNVERLLRGDVRTIKLFARIAQPVHVPPLQEVEEQFATEFDYVAEAKNLEAVRSNLQKAGILESKCQVPKPYLEFCTKNVLVMEELQGEKLMVVLKNDISHHAQQAGQSVKEYMESVRAEEEEMEKKGAHLAGPTSTEYDVFIGLLDTKRRLSNAWAKLYNITVGLVGAKKRAYHDRSELPMNHARLVDDLIYIHGHEVLVDGRFNADPHPGNILVCRRPDGSPHLGLIDYGQVKVIESKEKRHLLAKILIALDDDDRDEVVRLMKEAGFKSEKMDPEVIWLYSKVGYDEDNAQLTGGKHIQMFMEDIQARDPIIDLPKDFIMVGRCTLMLRGLCHALHQSRSIAKVWRPIAERVLREDI